MSPSHQSFCWFCMIIEPLKESSKHLLHTLRCLSNQLVPHTFKNIGTLINAGAEGLLMTADDKHSTLMSKVMGCLPWCSLNNPDGFTRPRLTLPNIRVMDICYGVASETCTLFYLPWSKVPKNTFPINLLWESCLLLKPSSSIPECDYIAVPSNVAFVPRSKFVELTLVATTDGRWSQTKFCPNLALDSKMLPKVYVFPVYEIDILNRHWSILRMKCSWRKGIE